MNKLQSRILRAFIRHSLFLGIINAILNDVVDYFLENYIGNLGTSYLLIMLLLNILVFILSFVFVARHFYKRINHFMTEEVHRQIAQERFLYSSISHDLKTPMTVIKGYAQALLDDKIEEEKRKEIYRMIRDKTDGMVFLLDDLLDYSGLLTESLDRKMKIASVDLSSILTHVLADNYVLIENRDVQLDLAIEEKCEYPMLSTDFRRICENLLVNAIKHNPYGVMIHIGLQDREKEVRVYFADSGNIIQDDRLFEVFYTGNPSRNSGTGHGLGLAIVLKLVEKYGGTIVLQESFLDFTKAFVIRLPKPAQISSNDR